MKTAYDLFQNLLTLMADMDRILDKRSKVHKPETLETLDKKVDALEIAMLEIRNKLKSIEVK